MIKADNRPDKTLHAKIGQLALENDFFKRRAHQGGIAERKEMIDRSHDLPLARQYRGRDRRPTIVPGKPVKRIWR